MLKSLAIVKKSFSKSATSHWLMQRLTAVILIPFTIKLLVFLNLCITAPYLETVAWLKSPINTLCIEIWLLATFYHAALGLQVVIEDYVANPGLQPKLIKAVNLGCLFLAVAALFFMFRIINP
jgi:succinate dehydrogenase / fumarate reductase, membrane anchor subunit